MGVYIPDMQMPTEKEKIIVIWPDGVVTDDGGSSSYIAVSVPPHGRLVESPPLFRALREAGKDFSDSEYGEGVKCGLAEARVLLLHAPTIIQDSSEYINKETKTSEGKADNGQN